MQHGLIHCEGTISFENLVYLEWNRSVASIVILSPCGTSERSLSYIYDKQSIDLYCNQMMINHSFSQIIQSNIF